jgi:hypothetical protein
MYAFWERREKREKGKNMRYSMKHKALTKQLVTMLAVVAGLALAVSAQAQFVTGQPTLNNINPAGTSPSGDWTVPNMADTALGLQITAPGGAGSFSTLYYPLPAGQVTPLDTADNQVVFTWTWNSGNAVGGINVLFALDDNNGGVDYYDAIVPAYSIIPVPGTTYSTTLPLQAPNQANIAAGFPIGGLNFQIDPANVSGNYTITMDSIQIIPEPASVLLVGVGAGLLGLLGLRRRNAS